MLSRLTATIGLMGLIAACNPTPKAPRTPSIEIVSLPQGATLVHLPSSTAIIQKVLEYSYTEQRAKSLEPYGLQVGAGGLDSLTNGSVGRNFKLYTAGDYYYIQNNLYTLKAPIESIDGQLRGNRSEDRN